MYGWPERQSQAGATPAATASTERKEVAVVRILAGGTRQVRSTFHFDDVLTSFSSQEDVFRATLQPLVGQVLAGYETTAFAYGQTGRGLVPRTAAAVLEALVGALETVSISEVAEECVAKAYQKWEPELNLKLFTKLDLANYRWSAEHKSGCSGETGHDFLMANERCE
ncbi:unnamed protein product [Durusdinium trenchii]|uniref:Kinesin motor domain-containing protein n=1 Tax=Durusdinium trenchii TaxID=1381693 RepID=A0ABP0JLJ4_9DINO